MQPQRRQAAPLCSARATAKAPHLAAQRLQLARDLDFGGAARGHGARVLAQQLVAVDAIIHGPLHVVQHLTGGREREAGAGDGCVGVGSRVWQAQCGARVLPPPPRLGAAAASPPPPPTWSVEPRSTTVEIWPMLLSCCSTMHFVPPISVTPRLRAKPSSSACGACSLTSAVAPAAGQRGRGRAQHGRPCVNPQAGRQLQG